MNTPITWEGPLARHEVVQHLTQELCGFSTQSGWSEESLRAEILRVALWEQSVLSRPPSLAEARVSTQRILRRARSLWQPLAPDFSRHDLSDKTFVEETLSRRTLESLAEQGDFLALPKGQWLPAPLRLVPIYRGRYLLVGGLPASLLSTDILQHLIWHDALRQLDAELVQQHPPFDENRGQWQFQTQESWLGAPTPSFRALLRQFQEIALSQQTTQYTAEVYIAKPDTPQRRRWLPLEKIHRAGRYLLRSQKPWGERFYTIGQIENGRILQQSQLLESWDIRRLCYALDDQAQAPTRANWNERTGVLTLQSVLPARERKLLTAMGNLLPNGTTYYYPRLWDISLRYEQDIQKMLRDLSIEIQ